MCRHIAPISAILFVKVYFSGDSGKFRTWKCLFALVNKKSERDMSALSQTQHEADIIILVGSPGPDIKNNWNDSEIDFDWTFFSFDKWTLTLSIIKFGENTHKYRPGVLFVDFMSLYAAFWIIMRSSRLAVFYSYKFDPNDPSFWFLFGDMGSLDSKSKNIVRK